MNQPPIVRPGDPAKNFSLKDQNDTTYDLYENMEKWTLLSFHPLAWTAFCAAQMQSLEDNREVLSALGASAVGISVDSVPCKKAGQSLLKLPILPCCVISGRMELWLSSTGFSVKQMVFQNEQTSSLTKNRTLCL